MWPATIRLVLLTSEAEVPIARGENAGSTIDYYNVVRAMRPIGMWDGDAVKITLPEHELMVDGVDACAVIVQEDLPNGPGRDHRRRLARQLVSSVAGARPSRSSASTSGRIASTIFATPAAVGCMPSAWLSAASVATPARKNG